MRASHAGDGDSVGIGSFQNSKFPHLTSFFIIVVVIVIIITINFGPSSLPLSPVDLGYDLRLVPPLRFSVELLLCCC